MAEARHLRVRGLEVPRVFEKMVCLEGGRGRGRTGSGRVREELEWDGSGREREKIRE